VPRLRGACGADPVREGRGCGLHLVRWRARTRASVSEACHFNAKCKLRHGAARQNQSFQQAQPEGPTWRLHIRLLSKMAMRVTSLFVYPIKSCGAIALDEAAITPTGEAIQHGADRVS
jgi:hypothetical protein